MSKVVTEIERLRQTVEKYRRLMKLDAEAKALLAKPVTKRQVAKMNREGTNPWDLSIRYHMDERNLWYRHRRLYWQLRFHSEAPAIHADFMALAKQWKDREDYDLQDPPDPRHLAIHEAGHAVVAYLLGRLDDIEYVKISRMSGLTKTTEPIITNNPSRQEVQEDIMIAWGGDIAEHLFGFPGDLDAKQRSGDRGHIFSQARTHLDGEKSVWELRDRTRKLLARQRVKSQIEALASAMLRERKLSGDDITTLLAEAKGIGRDG